MVCSGRALRTDTTVKSTATRTVPSTRQRSAVPRSEAAQALGQLPQAGVSGAGMGFAAQIPGLQRLVGNQAVMQLMRDGRVSLPSMASVVQREIGPAATV